MILSIPYISPRRAIMAFGAAAILLHSSPGRAQQPAPVATGTEAATPPASADGFPFEIGRATRAGASYSVSATQPMTSKLTGQKIRLKIVSADPMGTTTRFFTLATGKHKTVAQLQVFLVGVFRRFLAAPPPAPNQDLGKIGDLRYGGEVHFIAESPHDLRFDNLSPNEPARPSHYSRTDIETLLQVLTDTLPPAS